MPFLSYILCKSSKTYDKNGLKLPVLGKYYIMSAILGKYYYI